MQGKLKITGAVGGDANLNSASVSSKGKIQGETEEAKEAPGKRRAGSEPLSRSTPSDE